MESRFREQAVCGLIEQKELLGSHWHFTTEIRPLVCNRVCAVLSWAVWPQCLGLWPLGAELRAGGSATYADICSHLTHSSRTKDIAYEIIFQITWELRQNQQWSNTHVPQFIRASPSRSKHGVKEHGPWSVFDDIMQTDWRNVWPRLIGSFQSVTCPRSWNHQNTLSQAEYYFSNCHFLCIIMSCIIMFTSPGGVEEKGLRGLEEGELQELGEGG